MAICHKDLQERCRFGLVLELLGTFGGDDAMFDCIAGEIRNGVQVELSGVCRTDFDA